MPTANPATLRVVAFMPGQSRSLSGAPRRRTPPVVAMTVGAACEDASAMLFQRSELAHPLAEAPSRVVGWLDGQTVLVASGGCAGPSDLAAIDVTQDATVPLVTGVDIAAARTPLLGFVPALPAGIEQEVGEGVG